MLVLRWGPALDRLLGKTMSEVASKKLAEVKEDEVWLTLVVVALLELTMAEKKELWELVADKAMKFVKKKMGEEVGKMREGAKKIVEEMLKEK